MESRLRNKLTALLLLFIIGPCIMYMATYTEPIEIVKEINPEDIFIMAVLSSLLLLFNGIILKVLLRPFNIRLSLSESFGITSLTAMANYFIVFGGGALGKALYLKRRHDFPYSAFLASMSATGLLDLVLASILGTAAVITGGNPLGAWGSPMLLVFIFLGAAVLFMMFCSFELPSGNGKMLNMLNDVSDGWRLIRKDYVLMLKIILLLLISYALIFAELFFSYRAFSINIGISSVMLIAIISVLSGIIRIVPANIGVQEGVIALSSHILGLGFSQGLLAAGLSRAITATLIIFYGCFFGLFLLKDRAKKSIPIFAGDAK